MREKRYTAGPWRILDDDIDGDKIPFIEIVSGTPGTRGFKVAAGVSPSLFNDNLMLTDEDRANARLVSASPDLLEALEAIEYQLGGETDPVKRRFADARVKARAALAKAYGESE